MSINRILICTLLNVLVSCTTETNKADSWYAQDRITSVLTRGYWMRVESGYDTCAWYNKYYFKEDLTIEVDYGQFGCSSSSFPYALKAGYWYIHEITGNLVIYDSNDIYRTDEFTLGRYRYNPTMRLTSGSDQPFGPYQATYEQHLD